MGEMKTAASIPDSADTIVLGVVGPAPSLVGLGPAEEKRFAKAHGFSLLEAGLAAGASPQRGDVGVVGTSPRYVLVGLGDQQPETVRRAVGTAVRVARGLPGVSQIAVSVQQARAAAEGAGLGAYRPAKITRNPQNEPPRITIVTSPKEADTVTGANHVVEAVNLTRDLVNTPPNVLFPERMATVAQDIAKPLPLKVQIWTEKELAAQGFGGILGVGGGSVRPPRLIKVSYAPRGAKSHVALIGKGITFDSGGLNLKSLDSMKTMKSDMAGAASVLAAVAAAAKLGLKVQVTAWLSCAENMPSGSAYRPSDVLEMYGGMTVEHGNPDAEGRIVMADALARAAEDSPDLLVDIATLTGACVVALGFQTSAVLTSDDERATLALAAAAAAGEEFWRLPITEEAEEQLRSQIADTRSGGQRQGGALIAAAFLRRFTAGLPWIHFDIAGTGYNEGSEHGYVPTGGTGAGVRTLVSLLTLLSS